MKAYVELIQRKERELGTDVLTHQKVLDTIDSPSPLALIRFYSGLALTTPIISSRRSLVVFRLQPPWVPVLLNHNLLLSSNYTYIPTYSQK